MSSPRHPTTRLGFTLIEVIVTVIIFGVVLGLVSQLARRAVDQRRMLKARQTALIEVSNALEVLEARPGSRPAPGQERQLPLPKNLAEEFESPRLIARASALETDSSGVRLDVAFTWMTDHNRRSAPITLSTVVFPKGSAGGTP